MSLSRPRVAVVGAGVCGLATAALLARRGLSVVLLEALDRVGGVAAACALDGQRFSPGPQYIWGLGPGGVGTRVLAEMGLSLPTRQMPVDFSLVALGDQPLQPIHAAICAPVLDALAQHSPEQGAAIASFVELLDLIGDACVELSDGARYMDSGAMMLERILRAPRLSWRARRMVLAHQGASVAQAARGFGLDPAALRVLAWPQGIFAESLEELSVVLFAAARHHLKGALFVPAGGTHRLTDALEQQVRGLGVDLRLGQRVGAVTPTGSGHRIGAEAFDHVVFACAPAIAGELLGGLSLPYAPGHSISALCLSLSISEGVAAALTERDLTWYRSPSADIDFRAASPALRMLNATSPTLNGAPGEHGGRCVVAAFYPDGDPVEQAEARLLSLLRPWGRVQVRARRVISRRVWQESFGSHDGAVYGRRLTARSIRQSPRHRLPAATSLAHSAAGISGVLGALEMASRTAREIMERLSRSVPAHRGPPGACAPSL